MPDALTPAVKRPRGGQRKPPGEKSQSHNVSLIPAVVRLALAAAPDSATAGARLILEAVAGDAKLSATVLRIISAKLAISTDSLLQ